MPFRRVWFRHLDCTEVTEVFGPLNFPAQIQAMIPLPSYNQVCECASFPTSDTSICFTFLRFECFFVIALARVQALHSTRKKARLLPMATILSCSNINKVMVREVIFALTCPHSNVEGHQCDCSRSDSSRLA